MKRLVCFSLVLLAAACGPRVPPVGTILVYEIDPGLWAEDEPADDRAAAAPVDIQTVVETLNRRVNPGWTRLARVRPLGRSRVEIGVFGSDPEAVRRVERLVEAVGTIEFRILANGRDHPSLIEQARQDDARTVRDSDGDLLAWWVPVAAGQEDAFAEYGEIATRARKQDEREALEILVVNDPFDVTGRYLVSAKPWFDATGRPCISFTLSSQGGILFGGLTGNNLPDEGDPPFTRKLGIILNGSLYSAPAVRSIIYEHGEITGDFTGQEVKDLVDVLNSGALPVVLKKVDQRPAAANP